MGQFAGNTHFRQCAFKGSTTFAQVIFQHDASFEATLVNRAFKLDGTKFTKAPDFIQAVFAEAPRLDNAYFPTQIARWWPLWNWPLRFVVNYWEKTRNRDPNIPARWRALRGLAIEGNDKDREHEFFANEIRSARMATDGLFSARFWLGWAYQITADFGTSILRPLFFLFLLTVVSTAYFLGHATSVGHKFARPQIALSAGSGEDTNIGHDPDTHVAPNLWRNPASWALAWLGEQEYFWPQALSKTASAAIWDPPPGCDRNYAGPVTSALTEATNLALRNSSVFLDGGTESNARLYGCLFGYSLVNNQPTWNVPAEISRFGVCQRLLSGIFVFLFGLSLRNLLKMK